MRIKRPVLIDRIDSEEYILNKADDIWLVQNGRYDILDERNRAEEE